MAAAEPPITVGRYALAESIGAGGMAAIYVARQHGALGFSRVVAVKRLHPQLATEAEFVAMFLDEARLAARVRHKNVVETLDVVHEGGETFIVLEYVDGESLALLQREARERGEWIPLDIAVGVMAGVCRGLHAAHVARGPDGAALGIVHRDVSPQNVLVGVDGTPRVTDFGIALANVRLQHTRAGQVRGKLAYMAPEQLSRDEVTSASDIFAAGVVLWEIVAGRRAYDTKNEGALYARVMNGAIPRLSEVAPWAPRALVDVVQRALMREPRDRFASANEMADALEGAVAPAPPPRIGGMVEAMAQEALQHRRAIVARLDRGTAAATHAVVVASGSAESAAPPAQLGPKLSGAAPIPSRPPPRDDTQHRITHTLTSQARGRGVTRGALFGIAFVGAAALTTGSVWLAKHRSRAPSGSESPRSTASAPAVSVARGESPSEVATGESSATVSESAMAVAPSERTAKASATESQAEPASSDEALASASPTDLASAVSSSLHRRPPPASPKAGNPCDPPTYVDAAGIRRVKRDCF